MSRLLNMAWLSRHDPTPAQRKNLSAYHIHVIHPPNRFWAAEDAWALAQTRCRGIPDLIFCVMPIGMLREFLRLVGGRAVVIRAVHDYSCDPPRWIGWERIKTVHVVTEVWTPGEGR